MVAGMCKADLRPPLSLVWGQCVSQTDEDRGKLHTQWGLLSTCFKVNTPKVRGEGLVKTSSFLW